MKQSKNKMLDEVLEYLDNDIKYTETFEEIFNGLNKKYSDKELQLILDKLVKDKYADAFNQWDENGKVLELKTWGITFEGKWFIENNGYVGEKRLKFISKALQLVATWAIVIGTVGLLILEWWKYRSDCLCP